MLDDRKLSARALFDDNSQRQTQMVVGVQTGQTLCYSLPFHVFVSAAVHTHHYIKGQGSFLLCVSITATASRGLGTEDWRLTLRGNISKGWAESQT